MVVRPAMREAGRNLFEIETASHDGSAVDRGGARRASTCRRARSRRSARGAHSGRVRGVITTRRRTGPGRKEKNWVTLRGKRQRLASAAKMEPSARFRSPGANYGPARLTGAR